MNERREVRLAATGHESQAPAPAGAGTRPIFPSWLAIVAACIGAQLVSLAWGRSRPELGFASIFLPSLLALSAVTFPLTWLGLAAGREIGLGAPLVGALVAREAGALDRLKSDAAVAAAWGLLLGAALLLLRIVAQPYLPPELPAYGHRGLVAGLAVSLGAGVAEEVWFRLGLLTLLVWTASRLLGDGEARPRTVWTAIVLTSVAFGVAHLPQLASYDAASRTAVAATILGNTGVGVLYGWCYWRRSLVAAMVAHIAVDVVLHALPALVQ